MKKILAFIIALQGAMLPLPVHAQDDATLTQETRDRIDAFIRRMTDWGYYYGDLAGTENIWLSYDDEVKEGRLLVEGGDWAVFDRRLCSGFYGVSHEDASVFPITLQDPDAYRRDCFTAPGTSQVDAITLMKRYQWFNALFMDWDHVLTPSPLNAGGWDGFETINASYDNEKPDLANDPHLALYWLIHFGLTLDARYEEVKTVTETHALADRLDVINDAIAFFDHQSPYDDIEISNNYEDPAAFEDIYLKRRAHLIYIARSYKYASGPDGLTAWWQSIDLYPQAERYMIRRMRWLGNNLKEHDQWQGFSDLIAQEPAADDISLLSYIRALNPLAAEAKRQEQAARFLDELIADEQLWKNPTERRFGQVMIWDMREIVTDTSLLQMATDIYFADDTISEQFQDINAILNGPEANEIIIKISEAVAAIDAATVDFDRFTATDAQRQMILDTVDDVLEQARIDSAEMLFGVIANLQEEIVQQRALHFLYTQDIAGKQQPFIDLFVRLEPGNRDIPEIFVDSFPQMFSGPDDPNLALARQLLFIPNPEYRNDWAAKNGRESATMFFLGAMSWPENFDFFMNIMLDPIHNEPADLKETIFRHLLSKEYDTGINPTHQMDQAQLETMLETISDMLRQPGWHEYRFAQEAIRSIYYLDNTLATDWMETHLNNQDWLDTFPNPDMGFDPLHFEINNAIEASLDFMRESTSK